MQFDDTFSFKLESPEGDALITCTELPLDIHHELRAAIRLKKDVFPPELADRYETSICESVVSVEGLSDARGPVTGERVRAKKISSKLLAIIQKAYWGAIAAQNDTSEKKSDSKTE
jgi:hypothetical protein